MGMKCILGVVLIAFPGLLVRESPFNIFLRIFLYEVPTGTVGTEQRWQWLKDIRGWCTSKFLRAKAGGWAFQNGPRPLSKITFTIPSVDSLIGATFLVERTWALESDRPSSNPRQTKFKSKTGHMWLRADLQTSRSPSFLRGEEENEALSSG